MAEKKEGFEIFRVGIILFAITAVAALILATVNSFTAPIIEKNTKEIMENAMREVLPGVSEFKKAEFDQSLFSCTKEAYEGDDKGFVVMVDPNGYGGEISIVVGVDNNLEVTGISIISQGETAGLGAKCEDKEWQSQFVGKTENIEVSKSGASGNQIDAISSATITSKAVTKGVNEAISVAKELRGDK